MVCSEELESKEDRYEFLATLAKACRESPLHQNLGLEKEKVQVMQESAIYP